MMLVLPIIGNENRARYRLPTADYDGTRVHAPTTAGGSNVAS